MRALLTTLMNMINKISELLWKNIQDLMFQKI